jgi:radical SAM enzyme (TIGR01210 family)
MQYITLSDAEIREARPDRNAMRTDRPAAFFVEAERTHTGEIEDVATVFLTNRECPFHCLMCDLWKNTTRDVLPPGAILQQIDYALERLPSTRHIKLYNSGNFFDAQAIPVEDYQSIIARVRHFKTVIVENHPKLCTERTLDFHDRLGTEFEIAMGLETVHPEVLPRLNKNMTLEDFSTAASLLHQHGIHLRTFILVKPPFLSEDEGVHWAERSLKFAFANHVRCCALVPTRSGNGIMEQLAATGHFAPPTIRSIERVQSASLPEPRGRIFVDLWDIEKFADCPRCRDGRIERMRRMNHEQQRPPLVDCDCGVHP